MSLFQIFNVAGSGMSAQSIRLNTTASNLANSESVSGSEETAYKARHPVFSTVLDAEQNSTVSVKVLDIVESQATPRKQYEPDNPLADEQGYVYLPNVNPISEMANMISASRSYQNNVEVMNTSKQLILSTLRLGE